MKRHLEKELVAWKNREEHLPILLRGARQVGKSYLVNDFGKYVKNAQHKYLRIVFQKAPALVAKLIKYRDIDGEARSRDLKPAIDLLCYAGIFQRVFATTAAGVALHAHLREDRAKLFYLDVGLLQTATKVDAELFFKEDVKAGTTGTLRSLHSFMKQKQSRLGVRIAGHPLSLRENILSIPLYLISSFDKLVKETSI